MKTPAALKAAIDTLLAEGGTVPDGWLVAFLSPTPGTAADDGAAQLSRLIKGLGGSRKMLVGGQDNLFQPRPHILHRIVLKNAKAERFDYFFFPDDEVVISGYWDQTFPVLFPREADIGWLVQAVEAAGLTLQPPGEE